MAAGLALLAALAALAHALWAAQQAQTLQALAQARDAQQALARQSEALLQRQRQHWARLQARAQQLQALHEALPGWEDADPQIERWQGDGQQLLWQAHVSDLQRINDTLHTLQSLWPAPWRWQSLQRQALDDAAGWRLVLQAPASLTLTSTPDTPTDDDTARAQQALADLPAAHEVEAVWDWLQQRLQAHGLQVLQLRPEPALAVASALPPVSPPALPPASAPAPAEPLTGPLTGPQVQVQWQGRWSDWLAWRAAMLAHAPWWQELRWQAHVLPGPQRRVQMDWQARLLLRPVQALPQANAGPAHIVRSVRSVRSVWPVWPVTRLPPAPDSANAVDAVTGTPPAADARGWRLWGIWQSAAGAQALWRVQGRDVGQSEQATQAAQVSRLFVRGLGQTLAEGRWRIVRIASEQVCVQPALRDSPAPAPEPKPAPRCLRLQEVLP